jgi:pimeloyl-ACP methyl ester carboxylesterase
MHSDAALRAAVEGRAARAAFAATDEFDPESFTPTDWATLDGPWASLGADAQAGAANGPGGLIDDDVAFAAPWGCELSAITAPVLLVQGGQDRVIPAGHAERLALAVPHAEVWRRPQDGHVSVLDAVPAAMDWLLALPRT